jgi:hypothetical protein
MDAPCHTQIALPCTLSSFDSDSIQTVSSTQKSDSAWTAHINGAVALVKLRGTEQFQNPVSLNLFRAVRSHMVRLAELLTTFSSF